VTHSRRKASATRKVIGSVAVAAAAAAVAGLATFGTFTDSTSPVVTEADTGVTSIALGPAAAQAVVPVVAGAWLPGDSMTMPLDLINDGTTPLSSITVSSVATHSSVLDTDPTQGLQVTLQSCSQSWDVVGAGYSCAGTTKSFYSGPIMVNQALNGAASLVPAGVDHLLAAITLPSSAGNSMENASSDLSFMFTAVQRAGGAR
jgi:hypothetical protein